MTDLYTQLKQYEKNEAQKFPTSGTVVGIDGGLVDVQPRGTTTIIRNVRVVGTPSSTGQQVVLTWESGVPTAHVTGGSSSSAATALIRGPQGLQGEQGPAGPAGAQGPQGEPGGASTLDELTDVTITDPQLDDTLIFNGSVFVNAPQGTSFAFWISAFVLSGLSSTQEIGVGTWKAIGALSFTATYLNGPATSAHVALSGWSNLPMTGTGFVGPTVNTEAVLYPAAPGLTKQFALNAAKGAVNTSSYITFNFYNRRFWGKTAKASGYTEADVEALSNELSNSKSQTKSITAGVGEYLVFAWPTRLGTGTFVVGGFEGGFQAPETVSITNASGYTENYYVYRSTQANLGATSVVVS
jgi:hypothetical protein